MGTRLSRALSGLDALRAGHWDASSATGPLIRVLSMDDESFASDSHLDALAETVVAVVEAQPDPGSTEQGAVALWHLMTAVLVRAASLEKRIEPGEVDDRSTARRAGTVAWVRSAGLAGGLDPSIRLDDQERRDLRAQVGDGAAGPDAVRGLAALAGPPDDDEASVDALALVLRWIDERTLRRVVGDTRTRELARSEPWLWARAVSDIDLAAVEWLQERRLDPTGFVRLARGAWVLAARPGTGSPWTTRLRTRAGELVRCAFDDHAVIASLGLDEAVRWVQLHHRPFSTLPPEHDYHVGNVNVLTASLRSRVFQQHHAR